MTPAHYPVCLPVQGTPLVPLGPHLLCSEPEEILPGRLYHGATGFLFMADVLGRLFALCDGNPGFGPVNSI